MRRPAIDIVTSHVNVDIDQFIRLSVLCATITDNICTKFFYDEILFTEAITASHLPLLCKQTLIKC